MLPLSFAKPGEKLLIARVGGSPEIKKHLEDLGFVPGEQTVVIAAPGSGNIIVGVKNARLAITDQMASKIMVQ
jgi:ferrous iron transport protein A